MIFKNNKLLNIKTYSIIYTFSFFGIIVYNMQENIFKFIYKFLGKDITFTGRTIIWKIAIAMIKKRTLLGYGVSGNTNIIQYLNNKYLSAHNQFIQIALEGGLISVVFFINIFYQSFRKLLKYRNEKSSKILSLGIIAVLLVLFSEAMGIYDILILLCFSYNIEKIINTNKNGCKEKN